MDSRQAAAFLGLRYASFKEITPGRPATPSRRQVKTPRVFGNSA